MIVGKFIVVLCIVYVYIKNKLVKRGGGWIKEKRMFKNLIILLN